MKKRILCLFLGCVMILSSFLLVACAEEKEEGADVAKNTSAKTITLRIVTNTKIWNTEAERLDYIKYLEDTYGEDETGERYKKAESAKKQYDAIEQEISKITKSNYKTNVDIMFYTESEYAKILEDSMAEYALQKKNAEVAQRALEYYLDEYKKVIGDQYPDSAIVKEFYKHFPEYEQYKDMISVGKDDEGSVEESTESEVDDFGIQHIKYPDADENQIDIVYISGYDMYTRYVDNEWILPLNSYISTTGKQLSSNISPTLLNGVKIGGETYAIPNNVQIGEYTYMLVDKDLAYKYKHTYESFKNVVDCEVFVNDVLTNHKDILPIDGTFEQCMDQFVWYWNIGKRTDADGVSRYFVDESNEFSVIGQFISDPSKLGRGEINLGFTSLLADDDYMKTLLCLKGYEINGCFRKDNDPRKDAAVSFVNGTYSMYRNAFFNDDGTAKDVNAADYGVYTDENGKEYLLYVSKYPRADEQSLYGNMFAVSANTVNVQACVEVITLINTNSTVRNLLQYGIKQGEHSDGQTPNYTIDEETGELKRTEDNLYMMDIEKTGNCFIAYPEEGHPANYWEDAKAQNNDALIDPLSGFDFNVRLAEYGSSLDDKLIGYCTELSEKVLADIEKSAAKGYDELKTLLESENENSLRETYGRPSFLFTPDGETTAVTVRLEKITNNKYDVASGLGVDSEGKPLSDPDGESPYTIYYKWLESMNYLPSEK